MTDARLRTVEETLLGVRRHEEVDSWEIPGRYIEFLRGGSAAPLADVARHNGQDVTSLAYLLAHIEARYGDPGARRAAPAGDLAGLAGAFGREHRHEEALGCLDSALSAPALPPGRRPTWTALLTTRADAGLPIPSPGPAVADPGPMAALRGRGVAEVGDSEAWPASPPRIDRERLLADRARLLRRLGRSTEALEGWQDLATGGGPYAAIAWIEVAKALEHRRQDPAGALAATRSAQALVERARFVGRPLPRLERDLASRAARLVRRLGRSRRLRRRLGLGQDVAVGPAMALPTSGSRASAASDSPDARTQSRSGSNEHAIVLRSPASALR